MMANNNNNNNNNNKIEDEENRRRKYVHKHTASHLLKYEYVRLLGERASYLEQDPSAILYVVLDSTDVDAVKIAEKEIRAGAPFLIERQLPNGTPEVICVSNLLLIPEILGWDPPNMSDELKDKRLMDDLPLCKWFDPLQV